MSPQGSGFGDARFQDLGSDEDRRSGVRFVVSATGGFEEATEQGQIAEPGHLLLAELLGAFEHPAEYRRLAIVYQHVDFYRARIDRRYAPDFVGEVRAALFDLEADDEAVVGDDLGSDLDLEHGFLKATVVLPTSRCSCIGDFLPDLDGHLLSWLSSDLTENETGPAGRVGNRKVGHEGNDTIGNLNRAGAGQGEISHLMNSDSILDMALDSTRDLIEVTCIDIFLPPVEPETHPQILREIVVGDGRARLDHDLVH